MNNSKHNLFSLLILLLLLASCSKERVLQVNQVPNQTAEGSDLYITGSFNNWNPADPNYKLEYDHVLHVYSFELPDEVKDGYYLYTRGTAESLESDICGNDKSLRTLSDAEISFDSIEGWSDLDHPNCSNITFIVRADSGQVPATDLIYLTTESVKWEDKNEIFKFKTQSNGTSVLFAKRSPQNGLLFNVYHNGTKQFERPVEAPTFNDTITLTLSASASAEVKKVKMRVQTRKTQTSLPLPIVIPQTITLDPPPAKVIPIPPQYRVPAPQPEKQEEAAEEPKPTTPPVAEDIPAPIEEPKAVPAKPTPPPPVAEQAVDLDVG